MHRDGEHQQVAKQVKRVVRQKQAKNSTRASTSLISRAPEHSADDTTFNAKPSRVALLLVVGRVDVILKVELTLLLARLSAIEQSLKDLDKLLLLPLPQTSVIWVSIPLQLSEEAG
ncbi:hypothetical protein NDU88_008266 [Pleurodeles waltl]|uniref:Uncharacterized protein n=1 Tax=Pleurodeles waltl TaxID=8319 RepID=A0AAV7N7T4_PLEWA|nr:hypothetical protein NDU88_008266 [Pleurodeles waltl]